MIEFASLIAALLAIALGFGSWGIGMRSWDCGGRVLGGCCLALGVFLEFDGTIGLLLGWDFWSVFRLLRS